MDDDERDEIRRDVEDAVTMTERPSGDVGDTPRRYSLVNRGHDPLSA